MFGWDFNLWKGLVFWKIRVVDMDITFGRWLFGLRQGEIDLNGLLQEFLMGTGLMQMS